MSELVKLSNALNRLLLRYERYCEVNPKLAVNWLEENYGEVEHLRRLVAGLTQTISDELVVEEALLGGLV